MLLNILGVSCGYGASPVLRNVSMQIHNRDFVGIVGSNGSGKSTLLRTISRVLRPKCGEVLLDGQDIYDVPATVIARKMAVVPQEQGQNFPFTVKDVVSIGRNPYQKRFARAGSNDIWAIDRAMELTGTLALADRQISELSGGEKQRVLLARALAQEPKILLLDEPTLCLDLNYQIEIMELLVRLRRDYGLTIIMVPHDLNLASRYCDYLVVVHQGSIYAIGTPQQVITTPMIKELYGREVRVEYPYSVERPYIVFNEHQFKVDKNNKRCIHVVGGGGAGLLFFRSLLNMGWEVSTGVVNVGDSDWREAQNLGLSMSEAPPFCPIGEKEIARNKEMMQKAEYIIMADIPFGTGNLKNLECVYEYAQAGAKVIVVNSMDISNRDYTGGPAAQLYKKLLETGVIVVNNEWEAIRITKEEERNGARKQDDFYTGRSPAK